MMFTTVVHSIRIKRGEWIEGAAMGGMVIQ